MYNLLRVHNLKIYNTCALSKQVVTTPFRRSCCICSHITYTNFAVNDLTVCRLGRNGACHTSTFCNTHLISNELKKRKRYLKKRKQFTELLEIISSGHSETVAKVKNLKPNDVSLLAENPSITLEHVHDVRINKTKKKKCLSMRDNKVVTDVEILHSNYGCDHEFMMNDTSLQGKSISDKHTDTCSEDTKNGSNDINIALTEEVINDIQEEIHGLNSVREVVTVLNDPVIKRDLLKEIKDEKRSDAKIPILVATGQQKQPSKRKRNMSLSFTDKEELAKVKAIELSKAGKLQNVNSVLLAYIDTCVSCGFLNRALATLQYYVKRSKSNRSLLLPSDMKIFDSLLQGFAAKGKVEKFQDVWNLVKYLKLKPTCNSYALQLECVARSTKDYDELQRVYQETLSEMNKEGITLNDLFQKSTFLGNQREVILEALHRVYPEHKPEITPPDLCYSCSLLQKLNEENASLLRSPAEGLFSSEQLKKFSKEQFQYEIQGNVPIRSIEKRPDPSPFAHVYREKLDTLKKMWEKDILKALERDINLMNAALNHTKSFKHSTLFPYLKVLTPEQYKDIIMQEICKLAEGSESFSPTTFQLYRGLGLKVRSRYIVKYKQCHGILDKTQQLYEKYCDWYADPANQGQQSKNSRQEWQKLIFLNQEGPTINTDEKVWPTGILVSLGKFLYNIILHDIKIDVNVLRLSSQNQQLLPAFYTIFRQQSNHSVEEVKPHPVLSKLIRATEPEELLFDVNFVPMACPPLPWTSPDSGGYLIVKSDFLRLPCQALQQREKLESLPPSQLYPSFDSLNQLSCVPWKVNTKVLDTMIEVFNDGGSSKLEVPEPPSACPVPEPVTPEMSKVERYQIFKKRMAVRRKKAEMYSLWCDALYRLSLANHFRDRVFWLPHNMDFRGRVYPCPPHLNHLGSDLARSLLCFAKGKPLGDTGLDWLKIHVVNLTGLKKKNSVIERLLYANEIIDDVIDSAQKPLTGRMWWAESENPWQTLACCVEIWDAIQHPGGPESFVSHFPVHQDGSCNGLQHYAALGRDKDGAASVNLSPALIPQDVYSCVAAIVEKERAADAAKGLKVAQQLDGFIQRKVIKQTVMTTVYGVTRYGARLQIAKQLKDIEAFPKDYVWSASTYLVGKTFESLRQMFTSTREIQDWFTECARLISQVCGQNVEYVTPLGLPVVQPYTRRKLVSIPQTSLGRVDNTNLYSVDKFERPNVMKQKNAFPPNFIHSLDSSHMMLTSLFCEQQGITFVSVHDCYWTHPCTVHIMNKVCREQFVSLHAQPILEDLSAFLIDKFSYPEKDLEDDPSNITTAKLRLNHTLKKVPPKGVFQLEKVMDSIYFFS